MQTWTAETLTQKFASLNGETESVFHIELSNEVQSPYITVAGDAQAGQVTLRYSEPERWGYLRDRRLHNNKKELCVYFGNQLDLIPFEETISIADALKIAIHFIEYHKLPALPEDLYWIDI